MPLTSSTYTDPSRAGSRSTPAYSAPTAAAARTASALHASESATGSGAPASGQVGPPPVGPPLDGGQHPASDDEGAEVAALVVHGALQIVDAADLLDRLEHPECHVLVADPAMPRPIEPNRGFTITSPSARNAANASSIVSQTIVSGVGTALLQQCEVQNLSTVRSMVPGRVHDPNAPVLQAVERVHPVHDLLEGARRDDAGEHGVGAIEVGRAASEAGPAPIDATSPS